MDKCIKIALFLSARPVDGAGLVCVAPLEQCDEVGGSIALARGGWIPACAGMTGVAKAKGLEEAAETRGAACFFVQSLRAAGGVRRLLQPTLRLAAGKKSGR